MKTGAQRRFPTLLAGAVLSGLLLAPGTAFAWASQDHYGITIEECDATTLKKPANTTAARWAQLTSWAGSSRGWSNPFDAEICDWFARASRLADAYIFDIDAAHSQTSYYGGVNWLGGTLIQSKDQTTRLDDPRYGLNWTWSFTHAQFAPDIIVDTPWPDGQGNRAASDPRSQYMICPDANPPCDDSTKVTVAQVMNAKLGTEGTIAKLVDYFVGRWNLALTRGGVTGSNLDNLRNGTVGVKAGYTPEILDGKLNGFFHASEPVAKDYEIIDGPQSNVNSPPVTWLRDLGDMLHQFQDSCTHQGITGAQHAYLAYGLSANPDSLTADRLNVCTRNLTRMFFDTLAQFVAEWGYETDGCGADKSKIIYISAVMYGLRMSYTLGAASRAYYSMAPLMTGDTGSAVTDYWFQMCDVQCRDQDPSHVLGPQCNDTRMNNQAMYDFWSDLLLSSSTDVWPGLRRTAQIQAVKTAWTTGNKATAGYWYAADSASWPAQPALGLRRFPEGTPYGVGAIATPYQECPRTVNRAVGYKNSFGFDSNPANWVCSENGDPVWFPYSGSRAAILAAYPGSRVQDYLRGIPREPDDMDFDVACNQVP